MHEHLHDKSKYISIEHPVMLFPCVNDERYPLWFKDLKKIVNAGTQTGILNYVFRVGDIKSVYKITETLKNSGNKPVKYNFVMDWPCILSGNKLPKSEQNIYTLRINAAEVEAVIKQVALHYDYPVQLICPKGANDVTCNSVKNLAIDNEYKITINPEVDLYQVGTTNGMQWAELDDLYVKIIDLMRDKPDARIMMYYGMLPTRLMTEHPCNGYVCSRHTCHSGKNNLPRRIYLDLNGSVLPEHPCINEHYSMGNLNSHDMEYILSNYPQSNAHQEFLKLARYTYTKWVQTTPFRVIPWSYLLCEASWEADRDV